MDQDLRVKYLKVFLRTKDFKRYRSKRRLPRAIADKDILLKNIRALFEDCYQPALLFRQTGVILSELETSRYKQYSVLYPEEEKQLEKQKAIYQVIESINKKWGKKVVTS